MDYITTHLQTLIDVAYAVLTTKAELVALASGDSPDSVPCGAEQSSVHE